MEFIDVSQMFSVRGVNKCAVMLYTLLTNIYPFIGEESLANGMERLPSTTHNNTHILVYVTY
jgi:hypothetical protein